MGFIFGGGGGDPKDDDQRYFSKTDSSPDENIKKQEERIERQERQEKKKIRARKTALRKGATGAGSMTQLVSQGRRDPMLGNPRMPDEQTKLGRNPR